MKSATSQELKQELNTLKPPRLVEICLRLARFKKENKELLTYLLFEADDPEAYILNVKQEADEGFAEMNVSHLYFAKKNLRKILRILRKHIRYMGSKQAEVELLLHFCTKLNESGIPFQKNSVISNMYNQQIRNIQSAIEGLHEDLQYDYIKELGKLK